MCMSIISVFSYEEYIDETQRKSFYSVVEQRLWKKIDGMSVQMRLDLIVKIEKLLGTYDSQKLSDSKKSIHVNLLLALQDFLETSIIEQESTEAIEILIIDDMRCRDCGTEATMLEIQSSPFFEKASYMYVDFAEEGVPEYMSENDIFYLPAIIFNTKDVHEDTGMKPYLKPLPDGNYSLQIGANFDPYDSVSSRGFKLLDTQTREMLFSESYILWQENAEITWLEYSDIECPFCAKLHNSGAIQKVADHFGDSVNFTFHHFPLAFHSHAQEAAELLECVANESWVAAFYDTIDDFFMLHYEWGFSLSSMKEIIEDQEVDSEACLEAEYFSEKISTQMSTGQELFWITGTPSSVIINNKTGEYVVIPGAYPYETFQSTIESLLQ